MPFNPETLFTQYPLEDLGELVQMARNNGARRLLLLAGKYPVCRIDNQLSPPLTPHKLHFNQMQALANAILSAEEQATLDNAGSVESAVLIEREEIPISVFYGDGSHNVILFLG